MRAGWHLRAERALAHAADKPCGKCGHRIGDHRELRATFLSLDGATVVETPNPDYEPLAFYCHAEGCECVRKERA